MPGPGFVSRFSAGMRWDRLEKSLEVTSSLDSLCSACFLVSSNRCLHTDPGARFNGQLCCSLGRSRFGINAQERLGAGKAQQHPGTVGERDLQTIGAVKICDAPPEKGRKIRFQPRKRLHLYIFWQVKIGPQGPALAPNAPEQRAQLLGERGVPDRHHFRDEQARENAVFFRDVPANRKASAFLAAQSDLVLLDQLADVFEAHGSLKNRD